MLSIFTISKQHVPAGRVRDFRDAYYARTEGQVTHH